MLVCSQT